MTKKTTITEKSYTIFSVLSEDCTEIGCRQYGSGPGLILVHGGMMSAQVFSQLASLLSGDFTVYVPDRRGRGMSGPCAPSHSIQQEVEDMRALLDKTGAHNVFGLSAGAIISLESALQIQAIHKLAVYEPPIPLTGQESTVGWLPRYEKELAENNLGAALLTVSRGTGASTFLTGLPRFISVPFMNFAIKAQAKETKQGEIPLRSLIPAMLYDAHVVKSMKDTIEHFAAIQAKTLLMNGTKSPENLKAPIAGLSKYLPDAKHIVFQDADHLAATNGKRPRVIADALREFFNSKP